MRQAEAEGLTLLQSESSNSGYKGVSFNSSSKSKPYQAKVWRGGKTVSLGYFTSVEEAALCYARTPEAQAAVAAAPALPQPPPMTAEEALRQAKADGLTLIRSERSTGFRGVTRSGSKSRPFKAQVQRGGKHVTLGYFATAEEAALSYARTPEGQAAAAAYPPMTAEEALRQAEEEGLTLLPWEGSSTGFKGVAFIRRCKSHPYQAWLWRGGKNVNLGYFATAEEAALNYARSPEAQAAAAAQPLTAEEALRRVEAEGLTLLKSDNTSGFKFVTFSSGKKHTKPYQARVQQGGKEVFLGTFMTAEEAALHVARRSAALAAARQPRAASSRKRKVRPEEEPAHMQVVILEGQFVV